MKSKLIVLLGLCAIIFFQFWIPAYSREADICEECMTQKCAPGYQDCMESCELDSFACSARCNFGYEGCRNSKCSKACSALIDTKKQLDRGKRTQTKSE